MSSMKNSVQLIGHLGADPKIVQLENDKVLAKFNMATSVPYTDKAGQRQTDTQWHQIVAFNGSAKIVEKYLVKGNQVGIEGKLQTRHYEKDGQKHYVTEIIANEVMLMGNNARS